METVGQSHEDLQQILDDLELCREAIQSSRLNRVGGANSDEHDDEEFLDNDEDSFDSDDCSSCESDDSSVDNDDYSDNSECSCVCIRRVNNDDFCGDSDLEDISVNNKDST